MILKNKLLCGVARTVITPKVGCNLYGYRPDIYSTVVNDYLTSTAFYFDDGEKAAMMISVTVGNVENALDRRIRAEIASELSIPMGNIILAAIHTHSGPITKGSEGWGGIDTEYVEEIFIPQVIESARQAKKNAAYVTVGIAQGLSYVGINRRELRINNQIHFGQNPWGCFNPNMTVVSFKNEAGDVIGNMIHYGCHCTAAGHNTEITRDWAGPMIDKVEEISGGITAFFNGPEGDVGPRLPNGRTCGKETVKDAIELGGIAAFDAVAIYRTIKVWREVNLEAVDAVLSIPVKARMSREEAKKVYDSFPEDSINWQAQARAHAKKVMDSYENGYTDVEKRDYGQSIIRIGDVAFVSYSFELFSEIAMRIDRASRIPYVLGLSNSNGSDGYFPTEDQICRGGYEITMWQTSDVQPFVDDADFAIVTETLENLNKLG